MGTNNLTEKQLSFEKFRYNLRSLMEYKGMLGKELAEEIGTTQPTISRYLTGVREPDLEYVYRIANYFNVTIDYLLGVNDDSNTGYRSDARLIAKLFSRASKSDQDVVITLLRKYEDKQ